MNASMTKKVNEGKAETEKDRQTLREWEWEHGELRHCLAESPVISRSWTCRDCWPGWRSGVHTITVYPAGEISTGGKSTLWPPTLPDTSVHSPHTSSSHTFLTYSQYWPVRVPHSASVSIRLRLMSHFTSQTKALNAPLLRCCIVETCW